MRTHFVLLFTSTINYIHKKIIVDFLIKNTYILLGLKKENKTQISKPLTFNPLLQYKGNLKFLLLILCVNYSQLNNAQENRLIDNKGTLKKVNSNKVYTATTDPNIPTVIAVENDVWINTGTTPTTINIFNGTSWVGYTHTGTQGSIFYAAISGLPTEENTELFWKEAGIGGNRLGIGTKYPSHKLQVTEIIRTNGLFNSNGSVTRPSYRFSSDSRTGLYWPATSQLGFTTDGIEALRIDASQDVNVLKNLSVAGSYKDSNGNVGTNGQVLSSTVTGTAWINSPAVIPGDIKYDMHETTDHNGWYLLDGRLLATLSLSASAQTNATSLSLGVSLPDARDRVLKHPKSGETLGDTDGEVTTTLTQSNLPNINFTGFTNTTGSHSHTISGDDRGTRNRTFFEWLLGASNLDTYEIGSGTSSTSGTGDHNHTATVNSGGSSTPFERYQPYLVVNTFIYLGL